MLTISVTYRSKVVSGIWLSDRTFCKQIAGKLGGDLGGHRGSTHPLEQINESPIERNSEYAPWMQLTSFNLEVEQKLKLERYLFEIIYLCNRFKIPRLC